MVTNAHDAFTEALSGLRSLSLRPEISYSEIPAPSRLAPHSVALSAEIVDQAGDDLASGRLIVLHDPDGVDEWDGDFRIVCFARGPIEHELSSDPMLTDIGWSWLIECLHGLEYRCLGGTVTRTDSVSYADLADRPQEGLIEIRASWTPSGSIVDHAHAWADLLTQTAGLPPLPEGVAHLRPGRR